MLLKMPMRKKDLKPAQADAIAAGTYVKREKPLELPSKFLTSFMQWISDIRPLFVRDKCAL